MRGMDHSRKGRWLLRGAALIFVFVFALSMHVQQLIGWRLLILCFLAGSLGGLGFTWLKDRLLSKWHRITGGKRAILIALGTTLVLVTIFLSNRHKPDEGAADFTGVLTVFVVLALWGLYCIWSRLLDVIYVRFFKR
jgi:hypothetical protein